MAALIVLAAAAQVAAPLSADRAMANYRALLKGEAPGPAAATCKTGEAAGIVVCARRKAPPPRLPLPDERAEAGEVVRHHFESGKPDGGPPTGPPSRQSETIGKLYGLLKSAITGEDPDR